METRVRDVGGYFSSQLFTQLFCNYFRILFSFLDILYIFFGIFLSLRFVSFNKNERSKTVLRIVNTVYFIIQLCSNVISTSGKQTVTLPMFLISTIRNVTDRQRCYSVEYS